MEREKIPRGPNMPKLVVDIATGEKSDVADAPEKDKDAAIEFARRVGLKGSVARAASLSDGQTGGRLNRHAPS
jgi:hypothetical protein